MADGFFPTLVSKDANANAVGNPLYVNMSDGTDAIAINADGSLNITDNGGSLTVDGTVGISGSVTVTATDLDIRDLTHVSDSVKVGDGTDFLAIAADGSIAVTDNGGSLTVDGTVAVSSVSGSVTVTATDLDVRDLTHVSDSVKVGDGTDFLAVAADGSIAVTDNGGSLTVDGTVTVTATDLDIRDLNSATDSVAVTDGGGSITVDGSVTVSATDLDIRDLTLATDAVRVSANTSANSAVNPIFVSFTQAPITGEVHDYSTATVAGSGTSNHDYTVVTAFLLKSVEFAASGAGKVELQVGPVASLVSKWVGFIPKEGGVCQVKFDPPIEVPVTSTGTVRLIRTNREGASQDVYSTIVGIDA